jgi:hypothetical protein
MLQNELAELDAWLAATLNDDIRRAVAERGASMDPRSLRDLARATIEPHLAPST